MYFQVKCLVQYELCALNTKGSNTDCQLYILWIYSEFQLTLRLLIFVHDYDGMSTYMYADGAQ